MNSTPPSSKVFCKAYRILAWSDGNPFMASSLQDFDTYYKLMRYQTSLNNQLSKKIGELVKLEKKYAK